MRLCTADAIVAAPPMMHGGVARRGLRTRNRHRQSMTMLIFPDIALARPRLECRAMRIIVTRHGSRGQCLPWLELREERGLTVSLATD